MAGWFWCEKVDGSGKKKKGGFSVGKKKLKTKLTPAAKAKAAQAMELDKWEEEPVFVFFLFTCNDLCHNLKLSVWSYPLILYQDFAFSINI